jgi:hypothetical protein
MAACGSAGTNSILRLSAGCWRREKNRLRRNITRQPNPAAKVHLNISPRTLKRDLSDKVWHPASGFHRPTDMAEKVKELHLERDYKKYLYFIDGDGNVSRKPKSGEGETEVLVPKAIERDNQFLYFVDKEGDVARSPRATRRTPKKVA